MRAYDFKYIYNVEDGDRTPIAAMHDSYIAYPGDQVVLVNGVVGTVQSFVSMDVNSEEFAFLKNFTEVTEIEEVHRCVWKKSEENA